ncbi:hypothetical protein RI129_009793 [Pyrocoelia pectoralis]|uniref:RING-type E3 ubiquitin transferase n=1 Tax=Pyrocoelia pectoralis TaxID=417401 RepID=A0AAN7V953_9COLE
MFEPAKKLSDSALEDLRCYVCNGYLSSSPIRVLPNGSCICGRCLPVDKSAPTYRVFPLEAVLSKVLFPCLNRGSGCKATVLFNGISEHESRCVYYTSSCPITDSSCTWEGSGADISEHFLKNHNYLLQNSAQFNIVTNEDSQGTLLYYNDNLYIVRYEYDGGQKVLWYDIRYCSQEDFHDLCYTIQILNSNDRDCTMYLKAAKCFLYNSTFFAKDSRRQLNVNQFYQYLDKPKGITVLIHFKHTNSNDVNIHNVQLFSNFIEKLTVSLDLFFAKLILFYREYILRHSREIIDVIKSIFYLAATQIFVSSLIGTTKINKNLKKKL